MAGFDFGRWKVDPTVMYQDRFVRNDASVSLKFGDLSLMPYVAYPQDSFSPFGLTTQHGVNGTFKLGSRWTLNTKVFNITPNLPRGESLSKSGPYFAYGLTQNYELRFTEKNNSGIVIGFARTW